MSKKKKPDPNAPNPDCKNCAGRGCYPPDQTNGLYITVRVGKCKHPLPCKQCTEKL